MWWAQVLQTARKALCLSEAAGAQVHAAVYEAQLALLLDQSDADAKLGEDDLEILGELEGMVCSSWLPIAALARAPADLQPPAASLTRRASSSLVLTAPGPGGQRGVALTHRAPLYPGGGGRPQRGV